MRPLHYFPFSARYTPPIEVARSVLPWQHVNQLSQAIPSSTGGFKIDQIVNGANDLFLTAQKFMPLVQQAKPMFNNLPTLWRLYKGFKSLPSGEVEAKQPRSRNQRPTTQREPLQTKPSVPLIFQPPFEHF